MKKYTELELGRILEKHSLWLAGDHNGERANLSGADLREADFGGANLSRSDLSETSLHRANLSSANLSGANLRGCNLRGADLRLADLRGADLNETILREANLHLATLRGADLMEADLNGATLSGATLIETNLAWSSLRGADLFGANLNYAKLYGVDLYGAHLYLANLVGANLSGANLSGANFIADEDIKYPMNCPEKGSFIGFKKVSNNLIVELEITEDALRSSATGRKCRCSKAKVLSITNIDGTNSNTNYAVSLRDPAFVYTVGKTVEVPDFDTNRWNDCAPGIHFFISRQEAVDFNV